jgi:hypothetical protein
MSIPLGAGVRFQEQLGKVVRKTPAQREQFHGTSVAVLFDGQAESVLVRVAKLQYVARHYDTAKAWEREKHA